MKLESTDKDASVYLKKYIFQDNFRLRIKLFFSFNKAKCIIFMTERKRSIPEGLNILRKCFEWANKLIIVI